MNRMRMATALGLTAGLLLARGQAQTAGKVEPENLPRWYLAPSVGWLKFEGDEEVEDNALLLSLRVGWDHTDWWTWEGGVGWAPHLRENKRYDIPTGQWVSRLEETAGPGVHDTWAVMLTFDGLFHFTRWDRVDPYLSIGGGVTYYGDTLGDGQMDPAARVGAGLMYHFNDEWAVRVDGRFYFAGKDTEANATVDAGLAWYWEARRPPAWRARGDLRDSDGDGLTDADELHKYGTDPYNPDTDGDTLTDGEEVLTYRTNPLEKDTDYDGLTDAEEVLRYKTNPLVRDTDAGGVADGHEVIEDGTNPLNPADDLMLIELEINFDWDKAIITQPYIPKLDIVAKVLRRNPEATARIEGHADRNRRSDASYNKRLSQRRAEAALSYLVLRGGIEPSRLTAVGYGFDRPKAPNDPKTGNPVNRRVEIYLRGVDREKEQQWIEAAQKDASAVATEEPTPRPPAPQDK